MSAAHKITAHGYLILARSNISAGWVFAFRARPRPLVGVAEPRGHRMILKDCKRLAEVDFPTPRSTNTRRGRSAVEVWGRSTNRVIEMREKHGAPPPVFEEKQGFLVVTFRASLVAGGAAGTAKGRAVPASGQPESRPELQPESLDRRVLALLKPQALGKAEISANPGQKEVSGQLNKVIRALMDKRLIEYTLPDKPNSRLQKYRLTPAGEKALKERGGQDVK